MSDIHFGNLRDRDRFSLRLFSVVIIPWSFDRMTVAERPVSSCLAFLSGCVVGNFPKGLARFLANTLRMMDSSAWVHLFLSLPAKERDGPAAVGSSSSSSEIQYEYYSYISINIQRPGNINNVCRITMWQLRLGVGHIVKGLTILTIYEYSTSQKESIKMQRPHNLHDISQGLTKLRYMNIGYGPYKGLTI